MKKIISVFIFLFLLVGCSLSNNPTSKVEDLLNKYQRIDKDVEDNIDEVLNSETLNERQRKRYYNLLVDQYKNLSYQIKNERIDGDIAIITTEIEVINYKKAINKTTAYYQENDNYSVEDYNNTKLQNLEDEKEKVTYTIDFEVIKDDNDNWKLKSLNNETIKKIQGMY